MKFRYGFLGIGIVLLVHAVAVFHGLYYQISWFDVMMHFLGGYVIALLGMALYGWVSERVSIQGKRVDGAGRALVLLEGVFVLGVVLAVGVAWEWYEFLFDQFAMRIVAEFGQAQMGLPDTMDDLLNDSLGALVAWLSWRKIA